MTKKISGNNNLYLYAKDKLYISNLTVDGTRKENTNGKINFDCKTLVVKDVQTTDTCTAYNIFEQSQRKTPIQSAKMENVKVYPSLKHNVLNLYNIADNANIEISNCDFDLDVHNTNPVRLSNISNASNVTVTFKNVNWNYDNKDIEDSDLIWAGLVLIQPYNTDKGYENDMTYYKTWKFIFDNCTYNHQKIENNEWNVKTQVLIAYDFGKTQKTVDPETLGFNMIFK